MGDKGMRGVPHSLTCRIPLPLLPCKGATERGLVAQRRKLSERPAPEPPDPYRVVSEFEVSRAATANAPKPAIGVGATLRPEFAASVHFD